MKKILVMATLIIGFIGCSKDDNSQTNAELVGTWRIVDGEVNGKRTSQNPNLTYEDQQARDCAGRSTFKFLANGDFRGEFYIPQMELEYTNGGYKFTYKRCNKALDLNDLASEGSIKYKVQNNKIIMYGKGNDGSSGEITLFHIESLSGKTLKVSYSEEMKKEIRSVYQRGKQILQQYNLDTPENINVILNGFTIMEKQ
ncbi:lipocalin family protein [Capnocytophaga sp.]|uniref:lipocalin family protein n=1 Tax=Capnocytophaga sp. TaxID=44737 RepID=UPI0026DB12DD|nr:lipocalin family protein [Capnocytophaga sp.]MDO5106119.1 lipocalin family protein [Capnocytophaga sp.]